MIPHALVFVLPRRVVALTCLLAAVFATWGAVPWLERVLFGVRPAVTLEGVPAGGLTGDEVVAYLRRLAPSRRIPPRDAAIDRASGSILPESRGVEIDIPATARDMLAASRGDWVHLVTAAIDPRVTAADLGQCDTVLGSFGTWVAGSDNRATNIRLATACLNYTVVAPNDLFSFNETVGPRESRRGFRPAPVLVGAGTALEPGGGVCQASSTLYNAALEAGLEIVERYPHSRTVHYVPPGRDATVYYGILDLKLYNNRPHPIIIRGVLSGRWLKLWILGPGEGEPAPPPEAPAVASRRPFHATTCQRAGSSWLPSKT